MNNYQAFLDMLSPRQQAELAVVRSALEEQERSKFEQQEQPGADHAPLETV